MLHHALVYISYHDFVPSQVWVPWGSMGQGVQLVPQVGTEVFETQAPEQRWVVVASHWQAWESSPSDFGASVASSGHTCK